MAAESATSTTPASATASSWRELLPIAAVGAALSTAVLLPIAFGWGHITRFNNFQTEAWSAYAALFHGHLLAFLQLGPAYAGSLVLRAPFALIAAGFGGGWRATYFATGLPCLLAAVALGIWLLRQPLPSISRGVGGRVSPFVLCVLSPAVWVALGDGHPEEILGATLCAAAVLVALSGRVIPAGVLIGLAVINKPWAIVAVPVVLAALPAHRRAALAVAAITAGVVLVPLYLARSSSLTGGAATFGTQTSTIFLYPQLLWWFGPHAWVVQQAHVLLVVVCLACGLAWLLTTGRQPATPAQRRNQVLLLLCLVLLLRAALDPWDNFYYHVPFLFALMAYEARRTPVLTLTYTVVLTIVVPFEALGGSPDFQAAIYAAVAVPTIGWLAVRAFGIPGPRSGRLRMPRLSAVRKTAGRFVA